MSSTFDPGRRSIPSSTSAANELCNDDLDPPIVLASRISIALTQGQMVTIVIDGSGSESGMFVLRINGNCPQLGHDDPRDLGSPAALSVSGTTATCASFLAGGESCADGGDNAPDAVFLYTAPFAGDFAIDTIGSGYDTQLAVRVLSCTGPELACNDDIDPPTNNQSALSLALSLGETILIAVDGFDSAGGPFTLNIRSTPATLTPTPTRTATTTHTASATRTASRSATSSRTATASRTGTRTRTPTRSATTTATGTPTRSVTVARSATATATPTHSATPSPSATSSRSPTATTTLTSVPTASVTRSPTATPMFVPPAAPSDLTCRAEIGTAGWVIHLAWEDNSSLETEFHIERAVNGGVFSEIASVPANTTTYVEGPVADGITLSYRVRGHRHANDTFSGYSNVATCTTTVPTRTATARFSATSTPSASATPTFTPASLPPAFCRPTRFGGIACKIDFERLPDGSRPQPFAEVIRDQYRSATGVSFPDGGWVLEPLAGTSSPDLAFMNATSGGQEFNLGPLPISFTGVRVKRLALRVGLNQPIAGAHPVLTVFDETGSRSSATTGMPFADGPSRIDQLIEARPADFAIARAELLYDGDTPTARNAVEIVDDVTIELDGPPPCPAGSDTEPPLVTIFAPFDGAVFNSKNLPELRGAISEGSATLTGVRAEIVGSTGSSVVDLGPYVGHDAADATRFVFSIRNLTLFDGANDITVRAADGACPANRGAASLRVDFEAPDPNLNVYALAIEITQNVQDVLQVRSVSKEGSDPSLFRPIPYGAAMPLIAGKLTAVRAYPGINDVPALVRGIPAELRIKRGDMEVRLIGDPITVDPADTVLTDTGLLDVQRTLERKRADFTKGWYFILPLALAEAGQIDELELRVNPTSQFGPLECSGCNDAANALTVSDIPFRDSGRLAVKVLLARDTYTTRAPNPDAGTRTLCDSLHKTFPVREGCGSDPDGGIIISNVPAEYSSKDWSASTNSPRILRDLACKLGGRGWRDNVYHENLSLVDQFGVPGLGFGNGFGGSGCASGPDGDWPTVAQEIAHTWLLCHLPCGNPPMLCSGVPRSDGQTGDEGFHTRRFEVLPRTALDWMTYCDDYNDPPDYNNWVSAYVYRYLRNSFDRGEALRAASDALQQAPGDYLLIAGRIENGSTVVLDPVYRLTLDEPEPMSPPGPYELALLDAQGSALFMRSFALEALPADPGIETFHETIPFVPGTRRVVFSRNGVPLAERVASANPPSLAIDAPQGGESWAADEEHAVAWTAGDVDGDPLVYLVQYSSDDGSTWQIVGADLVDPLFTLDAGLLAGATRARIRVLASDGLHTAVAESQPFEVARKEPTLSLLGVSDGQLVLPGTVLALRADYVDFDGDVLEPADVVWRSDAAGVLGAGVAVDVAADALPPGEQVISVTIPGKIGPAVTRSATSLRARTPTDHLSGRLRRRWPSGRQRAGARRPNCPR
jgi:hypothetical protein